MNSSPFRTTISMILLTLGVLTGCHGSSDDGSDAAAEQLFDRGAQARRKGILFQHRPIVGDNKDFYIL